MACKPAQHQTTRFKRIAKYFRLKGLRETGRLQFFFHCPLSTLPIRDVRDVKDRQKKEPHIEKNAENYCVKCYQPNIVGFLKSREKYLFLFTTCASREPALRSFRGERFIVGFIRKEKWLWRGGHYAVQGFTKIVPFEAAFPLSRFGNSSARFWRGRKFDERDTAMILEHLNCAKNVRVECIHEIRRLTPRYSEEQSCR